MKNYNGKKFSILGDSISTLSGYVPHSYKVFYKPDKMKKAGISGMDDTWWGIVINHFGGELLVNNSWSGSWASKMRIFNCLFPSGCSDKRAMGLHKGNDKPDVVMVYMGNNDWGHGARLKKRFDNDENSFEGGYDVMLSKIKSAYPNAEIWCLSICRAYMSTKESFVYPYQYAGWKIEDFNAAIKKSCKKFGARYIDLYSFNQLYDSIDGEHPNKSGMKTIAKMIIKSIEN